VIIAAFIALTLAIVALWTPLRWIWIAPAVLALILALIGGAIDVRGVMILVAFAAACVAANRASGLTLGILTHAIMIAIGAGLFLHVMPGIDNPRVVTDTYSRYVNFDKGFAGLCLLGLYAPDLPASDEGVRHVPGFLWRFAIIVLGLIALSLLSGYVRWEPKLPSWWPLWTWSMIFLTALPEEAVFRGVAQTWIARRTASDTIAIIVAGLLFGIAHIAGGPVYVVLASVAGLGYGWVYASTRSIGLAIATHVGLNAVHFFLFTYRAGV
jgi:membrane protease YdiL (CAAX protease family)